MLANAFRALSRRARSPRMGRSVIFARTIGLLARMPLRQGNPRVNPQHLKNLVLTTSLHQTSALRQLANVFRVSSSRAKSPKMEKGNVIFVRTVGPPTKMSVRPRRTARRQTAPATSRNLALTTSLHQTSAQKTKLAPVTWVSSRR